MRTNNAKAKMRVAKYRLLAFGINQLRYGFNYRHYSVISLGGSYSYFVKYCLHISSNCVLWLMTRKLHCYKYSYFTEKKVQNVSEGDR